MAPQYALTEKQVIEIYYRYWFMPNGNQYAFAKEFSVDQATIHRAINFRAPKIIEQGKLEYAARQISPNVRRIIDSWQLETT